MTKAKNYRSTLVACFISYGVQAIVNNFVPLLFLTLGETYGIPLSKITLLITLNFLIQLCVDLVSAFITDRVGCRTLIIAAQIMSAAGLIMLTFLPDIMPDAYAGILISVFFYAIGGGLLEVLVSPIVEACPTKNKEKTMSLLHSAYSWGHVAVVLISTLFFAVFGIGAWRIMALLWATVPIFNIFLFIKAPMYKLVGDGEEKVPVKKLFGLKSFWMFMLMMFCAGACELTVSQWASAFAENGLGVSKAIGDLAGPMAFAALMGVARVIYGKFGDRIDLDRFMTLSCILCTACYVGISLIPSPFVGLIGCAVCGFSVGIFWPGSYSKAAVSLRGGGVAVFSFMALAGDAGATAGPTIAGLVSSLAGNDLHVGILAGTVFPILLLVSIIVTRKRGKSGR